MFRQNLKDLLDESPDSFPKRSNIKMLAGKTLTRTPKWHKAIVLVSIGEKAQLRLFGWRKNKEGEWRIAQKFNISKGYAAKISEILDAFVMEDLQK